MRIAIVLVLAACSEQPAAQESFYARVDSGQIQARLGEIVNLGERWSPDGKARFRQYWQQYYESLGASVEVQEFPIPNLVGETTGHNVEAVLPGASADSLVIISHYDSLGVTGHEKDNAGADDAGSGLAMMMESARLFAAATDRAYTVRFVAADYEEISDNLDGDVAYVHQLTTHVIAASDNDMVGWSCWSEGKCGRNPPPQDSTFQVETCSDDKYNYDYPELARGIIDVAARYSPTMMPTNECDGSAETDHYPFWPAGIPAYAILEFGAENNPHYDDTGDDTLAHIDFPMLAEISRIQIQFQAELAGIH